MSVYVTQKFSVILSNKVIRLDFLILERVDQSTYMINPLAVYVSFITCNTIYEKSLLMYFMLEGGRNR